MTYRDCPQRTRAWKGVLVTGDTDRGKSQDGLPGLSNFETRMFFVAAFVIEWIQSDAFLLQKALNLAVLLGNKGPLTVRGVCRLRICRQ